VKGWAYDSSSSSVIKLSNGMVLYLREVNSYLALVCLLRSDNMIKVSYEQSKKGEHMVKVRKCATSD
jgi:hypothetical protein